MAASNMEVDLGPAAASPIAGDFKKHESLWFEDGNMIIVAEDVGFRVFKGILAACSDVFRATFTLPQNESTPQEAFEECPVVRLHDSAKDMGRFLSVVFDGVSHWEDCSQVTFSWPVTRSVLTISHKYEVKTLLDTGISRLREQFPGDVESWDAVSAYSAVGDDNDVISMANMCKLLDLPDIHYRALYKCCQLTAHELLYGIENDGELEVLMKDDIVSCIDGRTRLARETSKLWDHRFSEPHTSCSHRTQESRCEVSRKKQLERCQKKAKEIDYDPLQPDKEAYRDLAYRMCRRCTEYYTKRDAAKRQEILSALGQYLNLDLVMVGETY